MAPDLKTRAVAQPTPADQRAYDDTLRCNRCGFCTSFCPTYLATGDEALSPRGRNQAFRALLEGRLDPALASRSFDTCLLCGICTSVCFSEVPTAALMSAAREKVREEKGTPWPLKLFLRVILPRPRLFESFLRVLFLGKRSGLSALMNRLGILRLISPRLAAAERMAPTVPLSFARGRRAPAPPDADVVQFLACGPNCLMPEVSDATARLVEKSGARGGAAPNVCCGLPGLSYGDAGAARALARKNIEILEKYPRAAVLLDDSSCAATMKEYAGLFEPRDPWRPRAEALAARVRDLSEWLLEKNVPLSLEGTGSVTYHDPCKARQAQKLVEPPRTLLRKAGADLRELPEAEQCCGGGGTYSFMQPEISETVAARKAGCIAATGADRAATSSVSCLLQLREALRRAGADIQAEHLARMFK